VVLPAHGAFPELIESTGGGLLVEPGSTTALAAAIAELLRDPARAEQLGRAARAHVLERFTPERQAARLRALLAERLRAPVPAAPGTAAA